MNLHNDKEAFEELLIGAVNDTVIQSVKRLADSGIRN